VNPVDPTGPIAAAAPADAERKQLREAAEAFESILLQHLVRRMRESQLEGGFFGEGTGAGQYEAMFEDALARNLAVTSPLGIADLLEASWTERRLQHERALEALEQARELRSAGARARAAELSGTVSTPPAVDSKAQVSPAPADENQ
jgi:Rod binding domain-containing protein